MKPILFCVVSIALTGTPSLADTDVFRANETAEQKDERMAWWRDAKFGMFVHWGIYAASEGQWNGTAYPHMRPGFEWLMCKGRVDKDEYVKTLAPRMTLNNFDPEEWASLAAEAGMKYFVITAKHHDGFGMVNFPHTDLDIADRTPYAADPMLPLAKALRAKGLKFGFYFSQSQDWSRPGGRPDWFAGLEGDWNSYVDRHAVPQLRHLLGGTYGDIDMLWFDSGSVTKTQDGAQKIWQELAAQPDILVNDRLKFGGRGDFNCPEQWVPPTVQTDKAWETCMTMNGGWGYNPTDTNWKSTDELIRNLCLVVSRGGNFLLNVGPRADGTWEPQVADRLRGIGAWMKVNGEAIYETQANPVGHVRWGTTTWKPTEDGCRLYCHVFDFPADGVLRLPLNGTIRSAHWLGDAKSAPTWTRDKDSLLITLNREKVIHPATSVLVLDLADARPQPLPVVIHASPNGTISTLAVEATGEGGVYVHYRSPQLDGWHGNRQSDRAARWSVRTTESNQTYRVIARYGFNTDQDTSGMRFAVRIAGQDVEVPVTVTGVEPDAHNAEVNQLVLADHPAEATVDLPAGLQQLELRAIGAPEKFAKPKGRANKTLCYSGFAMLEELRLEPVTPGEAQ